VAGALAARRNRGAVRRGLRAALVGAGAVVVALAVLLPREPEVRLWVIWGLVGVITLIATFVLARTLWAAAASSGVWAGDEEPLDLADRNAFAASLPARKFWHLTLLVALKDGAGEVAWENQEGGGRLRYRVGQDFRDLPAPPPELAAEASAEMRALAGRRAGLLRLTLGSEVVNVRVSAALTAEGDRVVLVIPEQAVSQERAARALADCLAAGEPETGVRHVPQGQGNCAVAAAAMLAGTSYEEAAARCPGPAYRRGVRPAEMAALLEGLTGVRWRGFISWHQSRLGTFRFPDRPLLVYLRPPWSWRLHHCVVVKAKMVHDPNYPHALTLDQYLNRHWRVAGVLQAAD
jgi:hypothetical protein